MKFVFVFVALTILYVQGHEVTLRDRLFFKKIAQHCQALHKTPQKLLDNDVACDNIPTHKNLVKFFQCYFQNTSLMDSKGDFNFDLLECVTEDEDFHAIKKCNGEQYDCNSFEGMKDFLKCYFKEICCGQ